MLGPRESGPVGPGLLVWAGRWLSVGACGGRELRDGWEVGGGEHRAVLAQVQLGADVGVEGVGGDVAELATAVTGAEVAAATGVVDLLKQGARGGARVGQLCVVAAWVERAAGGDEDE